MFGSLKETLSRRLSNTTEDILSEERTSSTTQVMTVLTTMRDMIISSKSDKDDHICTLFVSTILTWLDTVCKPSSRFDKLSFVKTLDTVIYNRLDGYIIQAMYTMIHRSDDHGSLVYRHYLFDELTRMEIHPTFEYPVLYGMMSLSLTDHVSFLTMDTSVIREGYRDPYYINTIRNNRLNIRRLGITLANRQDETDSSVKNHHAYLSYMSVVYTLSLISVIVKREIMLDKRLYLKTLSDIITYALASLHTHELKRGVLNGEA